MDKKNFPPLFELITKLWIYIPLGYKFKMMALFVVMTLSSFSEVLAIGSIFPFLGIFISPERMYSLSYVAPFVKFFKITSPAEMLLPITLVFCGAVIFSGMIRIYLVWLQYRIAFGLGAEISTNMFRRSLYQPYLTHISRNSSDLISGITVKSAGVIFSAIYPLIIILSSFMTFVAVFGSLLFIHAPSALACIFSFGFIYLGIGGLAKSRLKRDGQIVNAKSTELVKLIQEGLGGIRDVLIDGTQEVYVREYQASEFSLKRAMANIQILSIFPRYAIETIGIVLVAVVAFFLNSDKQNTQDVIPILGALAIGAQRLLPIVQQAYSNWSAILSGRPIVKDAIALLEQPLPKFLDCGSQEVEFSQQICLKNIYFSYPGGNGNILNNINLTIPKGSRVGFLGITGCGKTTLLDILMALLKPSQGGLLIDGIEIKAENTRSWQKRIAHVPQSIYLSDATIMENIAFGVPLEEIDSNRVVWASQKAQISKTIASLPMGYETLVGERGVKLSGGQRQRIGIARAIYKGADVLILDEATSALDNQTEGDVMREIEDLSNDVTLLIVAHRLSTLKNCTMLVELDKGAIRRVGSYQEIIG